MPRELSYKLPKLLREHMEANELDVRRLAELADVPEQRLYDNLRGQNPMSLVTALKVLRALGLDTNDNEAVKLLKQIHKHHEDYKKENPR